MKPTDRLEATANAIKQFNQTALASIDDYSPDELAKIAADNDIKPEQMPRLIGIMIYMRNRLIEKKSRVKSFEIAFPERCVISGITPGNDFDAGKEVGEALSKSAIDIKAKRLESSKMYLQVYQLLQSNLYVSYAVDRIQVLDEALNVALDPMTPLRDKDRYMKLFLDETRKPEKAKEFEMNFNLQSNHINIASVEDKMNTIAQALNHATAAEVIEMVHQGGQDDS
jgi:hypothetical protein